MRQLYVIFFVLLFTNCSFGQDVKHRTDISQLTGDFYIFTTYMNMNGKSYSANGMYLVTSAGVVMFDTPWDSTQFRPLLDSIKARHGKNVVICISTHSHNDRTGGLEFLNRQNVKTYTTHLTDSICEMQEEKRARFIMSCDTLFKIGQYTFQTFFPGHGHSPDNIVVWFANEKILYGGCFIKSTEYSNLGNIADADVSEWATSVTKTIEKFPDPLYVIPGHGKWDNKDALKHTLDLIKKHQNAKKTE